MFQKPQRFDHPKWAQEPMINYLYVFFCISLKTKTNFLS